MNKNIKVGFVCNNSVTTLYMGEYFENFGFSVAFADNFDMVLKPEKRADITIISPSTEWQGRKLIEQIRGTFVTKILLYSTKLESTLAGLHSLVDDVMQCDPDDLESFRLVTSILKLAGCNEMQIAKAIGDYKKREQHSESQEKPPVTAHKISGEFPLDLDSKELETVKLIKYSNITNKEIMAKFRLTDHQLKKFVNIIYQKFRVKDKDELKIFLNACSEI